MPDKDNISFVDQGFKFHIFSFKTNHLFLDKNKASLNELVNQTIEMLREKKNDYVCFNT